MALPDDLTVRPATHADLDALTALAVAAIETYADWTPEGWEPPDAAGERATWIGRLEESGGWSELLEEAGGRVVAAVAFRPGRDGSPADPGPLLPGVAHVSAVFVHPDRWRQGIAGALMRRAEQAMRDRGYESAQLFTPELAPVRRFYEADGWQADERRRVSRLGLTLIAYTKALY